MRDRYRRGELAQHATPRQVDVLAAFVAAGESGDRSDLPIQVSLSAGAPARRPRASGASLQVRGRLPRRARTGLDGSGADAKAQDV